MTSFEPAELPAGFAGIVRLFPLPNLVMFPHVMQPLRIFEPRYVQMLEDALAGDQLIAMALLQPGWESDYEGRPPIFPVTCLGRVVAHARLASGHYNILLQGLRRATIVREFTPEQPFRLAEVAVLDDIYPADSVDRRPRIQHDLLGELKRLAPGFGVLEEVDDKLSLGKFTDIVAFKLPLQPAFKQELLAEWNVDLRSQMLLQHLQALSTSEGDSPFPPVFSDN